MEGRSMMQRETPELLLTIEEAAKALRIGRTHMFKLLGNGEIRSVYIGRSRRISIDALKDYVKNLEANAA